MFGTPERPRLSVYRSLKHMYAQIIDDTAVTRWSLRPPSILSCAESWRRREMWRRPARSGGFLAQRAKSAGIEKVVFDRGGNLYHGRVAALAEGARGRPRLLEGSGRHFMLVTRKRIDPDSLGELEEKVVDINPVSKTVKVGGFARLPRWSW